MPDKFYSFGEILPRLIADAWADINEYEHGQGDVLQYEMQIRQALESGIDAGTIRKLGYPNFSPVNPGTPFDECCFEWGEVQAWIKEHMHEDWPDVPPWESPVTVSANMILAAALKSDARSLDENHTRAKITIEIEPGLAFVLASDIPKWIAERRISIPDVLPGLCDLRKSIPSIERAITIEELTPADWALLEGIWHGLPAVRHTSSKQFEAYRKAFDAAPNKPNWNLHAEFQDFKAEAKVRQTNAMHQIYWGMDARIKSGALTAFVSSTNLTPSGGMGPSAVIPIDDAKAYLKVAGFDLREMEKPLVGNTSEKPSRRDAIPLDCLLMAESTTRALELDAHLDPRIKSALVRGLTDKAKQLEIASTTAISAMGRKGGSKDKRPLTKAYALQLASEYVSRHKALQFAGTIANAIKAQVYAYSWGEGINENLSENSDTLKMWIKNSDLPQK